MTAPLSSDEKRLLRASRGYWAFFALNLILLVYAITARLGDAPLGRGMFAWLLLLFVLIVQGAFVYDMSRMGQINALWRRWWTGGSNRARGRPGDQIP